MFFFSINNDWPFRITWLEGDSHFIKFYCSNVNFNDARSTYNFLKDYNRSIHKGAMSSGLKKATKGTATFETMEKRSVSQERKDQISRNIKDIGSTYTFQGGKTAWDQGGADNAITEIKEGKFLDDLIAAKYDYIISTLELKLASGILSPAEIYEISRYLDS